MIITGSRFRIIGEALAASQRFKAPLARLLGKSEDTIADYAAGTTNVPRDVRKRLAVICISRGEALKRIGLELDPTLKSPGNAGADVK